MRLKIEIDWTSRSDLPYTGVIESISSPIPERQSGLGLANIERWT